MILLVTKGQPSAEHLHGDTEGHVGRLLTPRHYNALDRLENSGLPWAADNDGFQGVDEDAFTKMIDAIANRHGCLFVTSPDVVGDHERTRELWDTWAPRIHERELPKAFVLQDGIRSPLEVPSDAEAVFVGGTTAFKMGTTAAQIVRVMVAQGRHAHMGRCNSIQRLQYAASLGCHTADGSMWSRFTKTYRHLMNGLPYDQQALVPGGDA